MTVTIGCSSCQRTATQFVLFEEPEDIDARCRQCAEKIERSGRDVQIARIDDDAVREAAYESLHG